MCLAIIKPPISGPPVKRHKTRKISAAKLEKQTLRYYDSQDHLVREKQL
jgi:hypothetical protein